MINALHNRAKNIIYIENQRKKQKEVWETPGYRANQSQILKTAWETPGLKEHQSKKQKEVWETPGYRENHSQKMKERFENETTEDRRKRLEKYIKLFEVYDVKTNEKVGEWDLVSDFTKEKKLNKKANANIGLCLRGKCKSSNGFVFKYK